MKMEIMNQGTQAFFDLFCFGCPPNSNPIIKKGIGSAFLFHLLSLTCMLDVTRQIIFNLPFVFYSISFIVSICLKQ